MTLLNLISLSIHLAGQAHKLCLVLPLTDVCQEGITVMSTRPNVFLSPKQHCSHANRTLLVLAVFQIHLTSISEKTAPAY